MTQESLFPNENTSYSYFDHRLRKMVHTGDPETSIQAAQKVRVSGISSGHQKVIIDALRKGPATGKEIAESTGLEFTAVMRRMSELRPVPVMNSGERRGGCIVWKLI